jgi:hypothetical protein
MCSYIQLSHFIKLSTMFECSTGKRLILCSFLNKIQTEESGVEDIICYVMLHTFFFPPGRVNRKSML